MKIINKCTLIAVFNLIMTSLVYGQIKEYRHEISIQNDNDVYLLTAQDRYYTNGINLNYRLALGADSIKKQILDIEVGQKMYNGVDRWTKTNTRWDRPYAGYLYLSGELIRILNREELLSFKIELAQVGPSAKGEEVQEVIHQVFKMYEVKGWEGQIKDAFGIDLGFKYQKLVYRSANNKFEISGIGSATLGMNHINSSLSVPFRFGKLKSFNESVFTKGHINRKSTDNELFVYYIPSAIFQGYNSTIQGGIFKDDPAKDSYQIEKMIWSHKIGFMYAHKRSSIGLSYIFQSAEEKNMLYKTHQYGQLCYGLRF